MIEAPQPYDGGGMEFDEREANEACGVFGIIDAEDDVRFRAVLAARSQQHRGSQAAGVAVSNPNNGFSIASGLGEVSNVFPDRESVLRLETGRIAASHVRYSTVSAEGIQPLRRADFTMSHNGHISNIEIFTEGYIAAHQCTDSQIAAAYIESNRSPDEEIEETLERVLPEFEGAFSLVFTTKDKLIGVRDRNGLRPLSIAKTPAGYALASETTALKNEGWRVLRSIKPGEMVVINDRGFKSIYPWGPDEVDPRLCSFEFIYFSAPASRLEGKEVVSVRKAFGRELAKQDAIDFPDLKPDAVIGVPESGVPASVGYAKESGVPHELGLMKRRAAGRTFMGSDASERQSKVEQKLEPYEDDIKDKVLIVVDDSIVRGNTTRALVKMLKDAGAAEVHLRISSPPYKWPCFYGMDTPNRDKLIASKHSVEEIARQVNANSLSYLSLDAMHQCIGHDVGVCDACMTGNYPTEIPVEL